MKGVHISLQILDVLDCTGSGDVDTSKIVKADESGCIEGLYGTKLLVNTNWTNPSGMLSCTVHVQQQQACLLSAKAHKGRLTPLMAWPQVSGGWVQSAPSSCSLAA